MLTNPHLFVKKLSNFADVFPLRFGVSPDFFRFFRAVFAYLRTNFLFSEEYRRFLQHKRPFFEIS